MCRKIYKRIPMPKCDFNKVASNFIEITLWHGCSPVSLLHIFRTPFPKNTSGWLLLNIVMWKYINDGNRDYFTVIIEEKSIHYHYFVCGVEILLRTTEWNLPHLIMLMMRLEFKNLRFYQGNMTIFKTIRFPSKNQGALSLSLIIFIGKTLTVKNLNEPEIHKLFWKVIISHMREYPDFQDISANSSSCMGMLKVITWGNLLVFQKTGATSGIRVLLRFPLQHGW